ncbi:MAG: hypothetical protein DI533_19735 [Cereibacter sphaeroides]|uniref:Uncharacterized protein n=1 Tax=Cereibacter sphaeroides TaxID=1063 RepID=A0A2W5RZQ2_CERSP|nr:MAG: hypothetical protein DI533_19735 [Cereibacter sphaeroides]
MLDMLPRETRPSSWVAPLVEVVTVEPALAQQLVLAIGTPVQAARLSDAPIMTAQTRTRIIKVM